MLNRVQLIGNVGRDVELRHTPSGMAVAQVSVATNRRWRDRTTGEIQEQTDWHQVTIWGNQAVNASRILGKGRQVFVEGRLRTRSWDDEDNGKRQFRIEIVCDRFQVLGSRPGTVRQDDEVETEDPQVEPDGHEVTGGDDDIPF